MLRDNHKLIEDSCLVFKIEIKGNVFQINDNNRYLIAMSLTVKKIGVMLKFFESRSNVTIKVL